MSIIGNNGKRKGQRPAGILTSNVGGNIGDIPLSSSNNKGSIPDSIPMENLPGKKVSNLGDRSVNNDPPANTPVLNDVLKQDEPGILSKNVGQETGTRFVQDAAGLLTPNVGKDTGSVLKQDAPGILSGNVGTNLKSLLKQDAPGVLSKNVGQDTGTRFTQDDPGVLSGNVGQDTGVVLTQDDPGILSGNVGQDTGTRFTQDDPGVLSGNVGQDTGVVLTQDAPGILSGNVGQDTGTRFTQDDPGVLSGNVGQDTGTIDTKSEPKHVVNLPDIQGEASPGKKVSLDDIDNIIPVKATIDDTIINTVEPREDKPVSLDDVQGEHLTRKETVIPDIPFEGNKPGTIEDTVLHVSTGTRTELDDDQSVVINSHETSKKDKISETNQSQAPKRRQITDLGNIDNTPAASLVKMQESDVNSGGQRVKKDVIDGDVTGKPSSRKDVNLGKVW